MHTLDVGVPSCPSTPLQAAPYRWQRRPLSDDLGPVVQRDIKRGPCQRRQGMRPHRAQPVLGLSNTPVVMVPSPGTAQRGGEAGGGAQPVVSASPPQSPSSALASRRHYAGRRPAARTGGPKQPGTMVRAPVTSAWRVGVDGARQVGEGREEDNEERIGPHPEGLFAVLVLFGRGDDLSIPNDELLLLFREHVDIRGTGRRCHPRSWRKTRSEGQRSDFGGGCRSGLGGARRARARVGMGGKVNAPGACAARRYGEQCGGGRGDDRNARHGRNSGRVEPGAAARG